MYPPPCFAHAATLKSLTSKSWSVWWRITSRTSTQPASAQWTWPCSYLRWSMSAGFAGAYASWLSVLANASWTSHGPVSLWSLSVKSVHMLRECASFISRVGHIITVYIRYFWHHQIYGSGQPYLYVFMSVWLWMQIEGTNGYHAHSFVSLRGSHSNVSQKRVPLVLRYNLFKQQLELPFFIGNCSSKCQMTLQTLLFHTASLFSSCAGRRCHRRVRNAGLVSC